MEREIISLRTYTPKWSQFIGLILVLNIIDFNAFLAMNPKLQYLIVVIPIAFLLTSKFDTRSVSHFHIVSILATLLWLFGMSGIYWGKIIERNTDGALPLIWPLAVLMFASPKLEKEENTARGMITLGHLSNVIALECICARLFNPNGVFNFSHEKSFLVFFAVSIGILFRRPLMVWISLILLTLNFLLYPALTYVLCCVSALLIYGLLKHKVSKLRFYAYSIGCLAFLYYSTFQITQPIPILDLSYNLLNRSNNTSYREYLIRSVLHQINENIYFGKSFRGSVLVVGELVNLPVHNDFLTVILGGGVFCGILYLGVYVGTNYNVFTLLNQFNDKNEKNAIVCLTILINGYFFSSIVNPISMKPQNGMILFAAVYSIKCLIRSNSFHRKLP